jgi:hypothetical protein
MMWNGEEPGICGRCMFFKPTDTHFTGYQGECRVDAPRTEIGTWPITKETDWCGKFVASVDEFMKQQQHS